VNKFFLSRFRKNPLDTKVLPTQILINRMKRQLPFLLTTLRLLLGPVALGCALTNVPRWVYLPILITATLSDIYDGVFARRFGVATPALRRYDSVTDVIYYLFILAAVFLLCKPAITQNWPFIALILLSEAGGILVSFIRFGKYPATHSYLAKFYGLCLIGSLIALLVFNASGWVIIALTIVALITNTEIIIIHFIMDSPPVDVRSIFALPKHQDKKRPPKRAAP
jgi:CDP-diacylglycerol--glycerol-3-phosphate 3-phosphatidyltransferase